MTGDEFKQALRELGWKQADLCRKADIHKNTAVGWAANGAPQWVAEYLGALLAIKRLHDAFILAPPRERLNGNSDAGEPGEEGRAARRAAELIRLQTGSPAVAPNSIAPSA